MSDPTVDTATDEDRTLDEQTSPEKNKLDKQITLAIIAFTLVIIICRMWTINRRCISIVEGSASESGKNKEVL